MGRGRAKAKQTKVARQLKYSGNGTDLSRLQEELAGEHPSSPFGTSPLGAEDDTDDEDDDEYAAYAGYGDDDEEDDETD